VPALAVINGMANDELRRYRTLPVKESYQAALEL
jgi:hypothetical protein